MLHFELRKTTESVDCKTVRIFAYPSTREQSNKRSERRLKTESDTLYRFLYWFWGKKPTVLQPTGSDSLTLTKCIAKCLYRDELPGNLEKNYWPGMQKSTSGCRPFLKNAFAYRRRQNVRSKSEQKCDKRKT